MVVEHLVVVQAEEVVAQARVLLIQVSFSQVIGELLMVVLRDAIPTLGSTKMEPQMIMASAVRNLSMITTAIL